MDIVERLRMKGPMSFQMDWSDRANAADEIERLREALKFADEIRQSALQSLFGAEKEIERLRETANQDAKFLSAYHRICQKHGIAPSSSDLIEAMKEDE